MVVALAAIQSTYMLVTIFVKALVCSVSWVHANHTVTSPLHNGCMAVNSLLNVGRAVGEAVGQLTARLITPWTVLL